MPPYIPPHIKPRICKCGISKFKFKFDAHGNILDSWPHRCATCYGLPAWDLYSCVRCSMTFYRDFRHPGFCWKNPTCWDCSEVLGFSEPCMHWPPMIREIMTKEGKIMPVVFKKVVLDETDQSEYADVPDLTF